MEFRSAFPLSRFCRLEMTRVACFPSSRVPEVLTAVAIRFTDQFPSLREVDGLSDTAFRLHVTAFFWCSVNRTDGLIRAEDLDLVCARVRASERFAAECVRRGAWHDARHDCGSPHCLGPVDEDGWVVHDYLKDNPSRAELEAEEAGKSGGGKLGNHRRWHEQRGIAVPGCQWCKAAGSGKTAGHRPPVKRTSDNRSHTDRISDSDPIPIDRSDLDLDFNPGPAAENHRSKSKSARDDIAPAIVADVVAALSEKAGRIVSDDDARHAISVIAKRAGAAGTVIHDPPRYYPAAVRNEADADGLMPQPPPLAEILAEPWQPVPGSHTFELNEATGACAHCDMPSPHVSHKTQEARRTA